MMEAVRTSETAVDNHFTRQYNPEDSSEHQTKGKSKDFLNAKRQDLSTQQATLKTNINISSKCL
jgi:hypothetical protein